MFSIARSRALAARDGGDLFGDMGVQLCRATTARLGHVTPTRASSASV